jgi:RNA polymerase sigma-70 factor, ECF subfamily
MSLEDALARAQRGDAHAFNALVDQFQSAAYHVAYHHLGDADEALDACQEAMLSAWRAVGAFEGDVGRFRGWLLSIVINACRDRMRYRARRPQVALEHELDGEDRPLPIPDPGQSPEDYAQNADLAALLTGALAQLTEEQRTVILLDHLGLSYLEIADTVGVELGTVKSRLSRARAQMRVLLTTAPGVAGVAEPGGPARRSEEQARGVPEPAQTRTDDQRDRRSEHPVR